MKKNGFTVVELLTTFVLISIVTALLITLTSSLSKMYNNSSLKTELYYKQSVLSNELNNVFLHKPISSITSCGTKCLTINYIDSTSKKIIVELSTIRIGNDNYEIVNGSSIGDVRFDLVYSPTSHSYKPDSILNIRIPIKYKNITDDFGVNVVYQFNRGLISVSV